MSEGTPPTAGAPEAPEAGATVSYRVRFDECAADGSARAASYLRWAQDVAWLHSERLGYDRAWYEARSMMWLVRGITLEIDRPALSGETISLWTRITGFRRVWARRTTDIRDSAGRPAGRILTDWVMTDGRGMPARVPAEFIERFAAPPDPFDPVRLADEEPPAAPSPGAPTPGTLASAVHFPVRQHEVDPLGHANNAVYLDWADEALLAAGASLAGPRRYLVEYLFPALAGDPLVARAWQGEDGAFVARIDAAGEGGTDGRRGRLRLRLERGTGR